MGRYWFRRCLSFCLGGLGLDDPGKGQVTWSVVQGRQVIHGPGGQGVRTWGQVPVQGIREWKIRRSMFWGLDGQVVHGLRQGPGRLWSRYWGEKQTPVRWNRDSGRGRGWYCLTILKGGCLVNLFVYYLACKIVQQKAIFAIFMSICPKGMQVNSLGESNLWSMVGGV